MLKDQNKVQVETIAELKQEMKEFEMTKAKLESQKAEVEYNQRTAEYNVEIIKNQYENVTTEMLLTKAHNEKISKSFNILKQSYSRMKEDIEYFKKGKVPPRRQKSQHHTPRATSKSKKSKKSNMNISDASSFMINTELNNNSIRYSIGPSAFGDFQVETTTQECQTDIWTFEKQAEKD